MKIRNVVVAPIAACVFAACSDSPMEPDSNDVTAPTVSIVAPGVGAVLSGTVILRASADDDFGVAGVRFLVGGTVVGQEDTSPPYEVEWVTGGLANGPRSLVAEAWNAT